MLYDVGPCSAITTSSLVVIVLFFSGGKAQTDSSPWLLPYFPTHILLRLQIPGSQAVSAKSLHGLSSRFLNQDRDKGCELSLPCLPMICFRRPDLSRAENPSSPLFSSLVFKKLLRTDLIRFNSPNNLYPIIDKNYRFLNTNMTIFG
jgi:hypothetical protein